MIITCSIPSVDLNGNVYRNRHINLANIVAFDESNNHMFNLSHPSIKFTSITRRGDGAQIYEWIFETEEDRDKVLNIILETIESRKC